MEKELSAFHELIVHCFDRNSWPFIFKKKKTSEITDFFDHNNFFMELLKQAENYNIHDVKFGRIREILMEQSKFA